MKNYRLPASVVVLVLVGLLIAPFAVLWTVMFVLSFSKSIEYSIAMLSWKETPADIISVEKLPPYVKGAFIVSARYRYRFGEGVYYSSRVAFGMKKSKPEGLDEIQALMAWSFHHRAHRQLSEYLESGAPFRCFVDPSKPTRAVLYRRFPWDLLAMLGFLAFVFDILVYVIVKSVRTNLSEIRIRRKMERQRPDEPWLLKPEWRNGRIPYYAKRHAFILLCFAIFWNLVMSPYYAFIFQPDPDMDRQLLILFAVFLFFGVLLALAAVNELFQAMKYGKSVFELSTLPGVIGGSLGGLIYVGRKIRPKEGFELSLQCVETKRTRGRSGGYSERVLHEDKLTIRGDYVRMEQDRSVIPVLFRIPYDAPQTSLEDPDNRILWRLAVKAEVPGIDYYADFEAPVFKTDASSPDSTLDESVMAGYVAKFDTETEYRKARIVAETLPDGGRRFVFRPDTILAVELIVAVLLFVGLVVLLVRLFNLTEVFFLVMCVWITGVIVVPLLAGAVYFGGGVETIEIHRDHVVISRWLFGFKHIREAPAQSIEGVQVIRDPFQSSRYNCPYLIQISLSDGRRLRNWRRIKNKHVADHIAKEIRISLEASPIFKDKQNRA